MRYQRLESRFVHHAPAPDQMEPGVLYVSIEYSTALHLCCCGCGEQVVTPLSPAQWTLIFDGEVSLRPSVGNWYNGCRSHYFVDRGEIREAGPWSAERIVAQRLRDQEDRAELFRASELPHAGLPEPVAEHLFPSKSNADPGSSWWRRILNHWFSRRG